MILPDITKIDLTKVKDQREMLVAVLALVSDKTNTLSYNPLRAEQCRECIAYIDEILRKSHPNETPRHRSDVLHGGN